MKKTIVLFFVRLITVLMFNGFVYTAGSMLVGEPVAFWFALASLVLSVLPVGLNARRGELVLRTSVLVDLWTGELIDKLRFNGKWLAEIPEENKYVNNNVIHLADIGADPTVLIDNSSYPIASSQRTDADIPVALKKFETTNTDITEDELYALPYDKGASVLMQHKDTLEEIMGQYGLFSIAPSGDSSNTPIIATTGADNGSSRKRMTIFDISLVKFKMDALKLPLQGRILVLCNDHLNDLLNLDQSFRDRFYNTQTGQPMDFMGFKIFQDVYNPVYNGSTVKKAWGASAAPSTDRNASTFFYAPRAFRARGTVKMYYRIAELDPENRKTTAGFRVYNIVLPKKNTGFGAIVSTIIP